MSVLSPDSTEVWDDDFEFHPNGDGAQGEQAARRGSHHHHHHATATRRSTTNTQFNEDWDEESPSAPALAANDPNTPLKDRKNVLNKAGNASDPLAHWAEPGPSTPSRKPHNNHSSQVVTENWDDDFQDGTDSPLHSHARHSSHSSHRHFGADHSPRSRKSRRRAQAPETENWDDEFELGGDVGVSNGQSGISGAHPNPNSPSGKSVRWDSSSSDEDFGHADREDDRTVTSRSRRALPSHFPGDTPPPPIPSIPSALLGGSSHDPSPLPRSPTASVFSVPNSSTGGRDSVAYSYSSTAHLALRPTTSGSSFGALPPSPPVHRERERRRLRKKSRPPRLDDNIYELEDKNGADPHGRGSISDAGSDGDVVLLPRVDPPVAAAPIIAATAEASTATVAKQGLVSRIGSVGKKWGAARKKRMSTGPGEVEVLAPRGLPTTSTSVVNNSHTNTKSSSSPPPPISTSTSSRASWFFRHGGAGVGSGSPPAVMATLASSTTAAIAPQPLKRENSVDRLLSMVGMDPDSPSRRKHKGAKGADGDSSFTSSLDGTGTTRGEHATAIAGPALLFGAPRRPMSMAAPPSSARILDSRHASYDQSFRAKSSSRSSSKQRSASASVEDLDRNGQQPLSLQAGISVGSSITPRPERSVVIKDQPSPLRFRGRDREKGSETEKEHHHPDGYRGFMGGVRRISLGGKHKRTQSGTPTTSASSSQVQSQTQKKSRKSRSKSRESPGSSSSAANAAPTTTNLLGTPPIIPHHLVPDRSDDATPRPASRVTPATNVSTPGRSSLGIESYNRDDQLLPPIELQPPSPPRAPRNVSASTSHFDLGNPAPGIHTLLGPIPLGGASSGDTSFSASSGNSGLASNESNGSSDGPTSLISPLSSPISPANLIGSIRAKAPSSSIQAASLGRSTHPPKELALGSGSGSIGVSNSGLSGIVPRRNSLGDLKIPARISQAQVGLKRDLSMVRDFAASVEQLKELQATYTSVVADIQAFLLSTTPPDPAPQPRAISPTLFGLPRPQSRARSNTNPHQPPELQGNEMYAMNDASNHRQMTIAFRGIVAKYQLSWECAELLIELGGGPPASEGPSQSELPPQSRERAITLAGDEPKPYIPIQPPVATTSPSHSSQWRASTGRHDLSQRQLLLLREMLNNGPDANPSSVNTAYTGLDHQIPEEDINRAWRWGDAMSSTITLPSEDSSHKGSAPSSRNSPRKKRRHSRLGMRGLRDMLKSLTRSYLEQSSSHPSPADPHPPQHQDQNQPHSGRQHQHPSLPPPPPLLPTVPQSTSSISASTDSSLNLPTGSKQDISKSQSLIQRRRAKTSTGPESMRERDAQHHHPNSPYGTAPPHKSSPRRPSLASIFRLGQKHKTQAGPNTIRGPSSASSSPIGASPAFSGRELSVEDVARTRAGSRSSGHASGANTPDFDEDWDRVESTSDLDLVASKAFGGTVGSGSPGAAATVRGKRSIGKSPYLHQFGGGGAGVHSESMNAKRTPNPSQSSIFAGSSESPQKTGHAPLPPAFGSSTSIGVPASSSTHSPSASMSASTLATQTQSMQYRSPRLSNVNETDALDGSRDPSAHANNTTPQRPEREPRRVSASSTNSQGRHAPPSPSPNRGPDRSGSRTSRRGLQGSMRSTPPQTWVSQGHGYSPELQASGLPSALNSPLPLSTSLPPSALPLSAPSSSQLLRQQNTAGEGQNAQPSLALSMTPENIKPLLENAREVHSRCNECIRELRGLMAARRLVD